MEKSNEELKAIATETEMKLKKAIAKIEAYELLMNGYTKQVFEIYNDSKDYNDFRKVFIKCLINSRFEIEAELRE